MEQIGLGAMLIQGQVTNISTGYASLSRDTKQISAQTFGRELDKAKMVNSKPQEKRQQTPIEKEQPKEVSIKKEKNVKKDKSISQDSQKAETDSDDIENEVDEKILLLLSHTLNITVEQLEDLLNQMGYKVSDMFEQQNFSQLIGKVYGEIKGEDLLTMETGAKHISELFEKIQLINDETTTQNHVLSVQKSIHNEISTSDIVKPMKQPVPVVQEVVQEQPQTTSAIVGEVLSSEMSAYSKQVSKVQDIGESSNVLNGVVINNTEKESLGMMIPVQNFSTTVYPQLWKPEGEMSVPIPQMIETNIIDQIDFKVLGITKEVHLQLSPKELGELSIKLIEENSAIVAHIKVDNEKTKVFLLNQLSDLKTALEERGLTVVDVKVDINEDTHGSQMEQEKQKSSKRIQEIISKHLEVLEQDEEEMSTQTSDSEVDYMV